MFVVSRFKLQKPTNWMQFRMAIWFILGRFCAIVQRLANTSQCIAIEINFIDTLVMRNGVTAFAIVHLYTNAARFSTSGVLSTASHIYIIHTPRHKCVVCRQWNECHASHNDDPNWWTNGIKKKTNKNDETSLYSHANDRTYPIDTGCSLCR